MTESKKNWYECTHCDFKAKKKSILTGHLVFEHVIIVKRYLCPFDDYKTRMISLRY